jgi:hypothetical protein
MLPLGRELVVIWSTPATMVMEKLPVAVLGGLAESVTVTPFNWKMPEVLGTPESTPVALRLSPGGAEKTCPALQVTAVRLKLKQNQLVDVFGKIGVLVDALKGA